MLGRPKVSCRGALALVGRSWMLAGQQAFAAGETVSDAVAAILKSEPDWSALPAETPAAVRRLLRRCLTKDPRERLHDLADARLEIRDAQLTETEPRTEPPCTSIAWSAAGILALLSLALAGMLLWSSPTPADLPVYRSVILPPASNQKTADGRTSVRRIARGLALSPDGTRLAFVAPGPDGRAALWVRPLDGAAAQMLGGTEGGVAAPFWSPDGRQLAFVSQGRLKRIDGSGSSPVTLHDAASGLSGTWNRDNVIQSGRLQMPPGPV